jgi:hypothetical protein
MLERLIDNDMQTGRAILGITTDVTYKIFNDGYLLSSSVYSMALSRWVPVLFSYIVNINTESHQAHYEALVKMVVSRIDDKEEQLKLLAQIVDYSQAQANGFVNAILCTTIHC